MKAHASHLCCAAAAWGIGMVSGTFAQCPGSWHTGVSAVGMVQGPGGLSDLAALPNGDVAVSGRFTAVGGTPSNGLAIYRPSTNTWSAVGAEPQLSWRAVAGSPDGTIVGLVSGDAQGRHVARYSPVTQTVSMLPYVPGSYSSGMNLLSIAVEPGGHVLVGIGTEFESLVMRNSGPGGDWVQLGTLPNTGNEFLGTCGPRVIEAFPDGRIAAPTNCVERIHCCSWDESGVHMYTPATGEWQRVYRATTFLGSTTPFPFAVHALLPLADGDLVIGGEFTEIEPDVAANRVGRLDVQSGTWSALGAGLATPVKRLKLLPNGDIVALTEGGIFRYSTSASAWSAVLPQLAGTIVDMEVLAQGDLLVAGYTGQWPTQAPQLARYVFSSSQTACPANFSCSGGITVDDLFLYLNAWFMNEPRADMNASWSITIDDLFLYINAYFSGCP